LLVFRDSDPGGSVCSYSGIVIQEGAIAGIVSQEGAIAGIGSQEGAIARIPG